MKDVSKLALVGVGNWNYKEKSRHNVGFSVIEHLKNRLAINFSVPELHRVGRHGVMYKASFSQEVFEKRKLRSSIKLFDKLCESWPTCANVQVSHKPIFTLMLFKPKSFVNVCGTHIKKFTEEFNLNKKDLIVLCDDLDKPFGRVNFRKLKSPNGHNGLKSIMESLQIPRVNSGKTISEYPHLIAIGIGRPEARDRKVVSDYVLSNFTQEEQEILHNDIMKRCESIIEEQMFKRIKMINTRESCENGNLNLS